MKKIIKSNQEPEKLADYRIHNPDDKWGQFKNNCRDGDADVKKKIISDQGGLCAYCENTLVGNGKGLDDFRVDHFEPKSDTQVGGENLHLKWSNFRGVCTGGNSTGVWDQSRVTQHPNHSCDVPKGDRNLKGLILDPLFDVPAFPRYFKYESIGANAGKIFVDVKTCPFDKMLLARNTIVNLKLNAPRLIKFRAELMAVIHDQLNQFLLENMSMDDAVNLAIDLHLAKSTQGYWRPFFTCVRWILARDAEDYLAKNQYDG